MALVEALRDLPSAVGWVLGVIFLVSQLTIGAILGRKVGLQLLKLQFTFTKAGFDAIVGGWTKEDLSRFKKHFYVDFVHPLWYGLLLAYLLARSVPPRFGFLILLPILAAIADTVENFLHAPPAFKDEFKDLDQPHVSLAAGFATAKWLLAATSIVLIIA